MKKPVDSKKLMHVGFELSLLLKGFDGLLEIFGGILFVFISPSRLNALVGALTTHEISEDPKDLIANVLITMSHGFSVSVQTFVVIYLISHGATKLIMVSLLYRKKLWAYPAGIAFLLLFIGYQMHRYVYSHSTAMILLTVFDTAMIWLIYEEYRRIRKESSLSETAE